MTVTVVSIKGPYPYVSDDYNYRSSTGSVFSRATGYYKGVLLCHDSSTVPLSLQSSILSDSF